MDEQYDIGQSIIISVINEYIDKCNKKLPPDQQRKHLAKDGVCSGLVGLFMCDSHKLDGQLNELVRYPRRQELFASVVETLYEDLKKFQSPEETWPMLRQYEVDKVSKELGKAKLNPQFSFIFTLRYDEMLTLLKELNASLLDNSQIRIDSHNHSVVIKYEAGEYHFYNPNRRNFHEVKRKNFEDLAIYIKDGIQGVTGEIPTPVAIDIYSKEDNKKNTQVYPSKEHFIEKIFQNRNEKWKELLFNGVGGTTALHLPARRGDTETLQIIFDEAKKRDGNISFNDLIRRDSNDFTPVDLAAQWGHLNVIELFLKNDVPVCRPNNIGFVPLHHAIKYSSYNSSMELINFLLQQDNNRIDRINDKGESSLHFVSNPQICKWLILEKNAKINQQDNDYFTPLHTAIKAGNVEVVKVLLAHGADTSLKANVAGFTGTKRPHTPLQYVEKLVSENPDKHEYKKIHEELKAPSLHR